MKILETTRKAYVTTAIIMFTSALLLALIIGAILLFEAKKSVELSEVNPLIYNSMIARDLESLHTVYPGMKAEEIREILFETWTRPYLYEPFTQFRERPYSGKYVNVSRDGFREVADQGPWPPDEENFNIFMFGGSTVFGYGVADEDTIASSLGKYLDGLPGEKRVAVYNFGRGFYYSTQERVLYEQLITEGYIPDLAIFFDGLNEFYNSSNHPLLTPMLRKFINKPVKKKRFTQIINDLKQKTIDTNKWSVNQSDMRNIIYGNAWMVESVTENYLQNMKLISAVSKAYNVLPLFVWQPVPTYKYDLQYHVFGNEGFGEHTASTFGYEHIEEVLKENPPKEHFLWLANIQEDIQEPLYVDKVHYTAEFSQVLAMEIANYITERSLIPTH